MRTCRPALVVAALVLGACARSGQAPFLDVATTTSVQNSGLLETLLPAYTAATVRVHAAGSGRALDMLGDEIVDLVISHAPAAEARALAAHPDWSYRKLAFNRFVIVGPADDPSQVRAAAGAADAFARIAKGPAPFVSRGDGSGTHEREQMLWSAAGTAPPAARLLISGRGMAITLRHAQERQAYTLSDEATFWPLGPQLDLAVVFENDPLLLNTYAVIHPAGIAAAGAFADWLTRGAGRQLIAGYRVADRVAFAVWPVDCPGDAPDVLPCGGAPTGR